jgi:hypothetical protein
LLFIIFSRYGAGTGTARNLSNRNQNFSKVGTGTVKNSYGSTALVEKRVLKVVVYFRQNLIEVNPDKKLAVFQHMDTGAKVSSKKFYS